MAKVWRGLAANANAALPYNSSGSKLESFILNQLAAWEEIIKSEAFADSWHQTLQELADLAETDDVRPCFSDELSETLYFSLMDASEASSLVRQAIEKELSSFAEIEAAFVLGNEIDIGFCPPCVHRFVFTQKNPQRSEVTIQVVLAPTHYNLLCLLATFSAQLLAGPDSFALQKNGPIGST